MRAGELNGVYYRGLSRSICMVASRTIIIIVRLRFVIVGDPCIGLYSGHAYPCTIAEGVFITDLHDKCLSHSLTFPFSHFFPHSLRSFTPPTHTHTRTQKKQSVSLLLSGHANAIRHSRNACALSGPLSQCNTTSWSRARNSQVD